VVEGGARDLGNLLGVPW
jgi:hypothetical protein